MTIGAEPVATALRLEIWVSEKKDSPHRPKPGEPSLAYLERLVLEVRERLEKLEKRLEKARSIE